MGGGTGATATAVIGAPQGFHGTYKWSERAPCAHNGVCHEYVSGWKCDCREVFNKRTGKREAYDGEFCERPIDVCTVNEDDCDPLYATCHHLGPGRHDCTCNLGWEGDGHTCRDIDECKSNPCKNGATCTESSCKPSKFPNGTVCAPQLLGLPPTDTYRCACTAGFANGMCFKGWDRKHAAYTKQYQTTCTVNHGGHCDIDIDECVSLPCKHGACSDSHTHTWKQTKISFDAFSCACMAGWSNGVCAYNFIRQYTQECTVMESTATAQTGICDVDVSANWRNEPAAWAA